MARGVPDDRVAVGAARTSRVPAFPRGGDLAARDLDAGVLEHAEHLQPDRVRECPEHLHELRSSPGSGSGDRRPDAPLRRFELDCWLFGHQLAGCGAEQPEDQARGEDRDDDRQPERGVEGLRVRVARGVGKDLTLLAW